MNKSNKKYLLFDIGGTNIKYSLIDNKAIINEVKSIPTKIHNVLEQIDDIISQFLNQNLSGVAISSMGVIDSNKKLVIAVNSISLKYKNTNFNLLEEKYNFPIHVLNDANAAVLAEFANTNYENMIAITFGTGVGVGIIIEQKLFVGKNLLGGEFGYLKFENQTLDDYLSFSQFNNEIKKQFSINSYNQNEMEKLYKNNFEFKNKINQYLIKIADFLVNVAIILNLDAIHIGGGISYLPYCFWNILYFHFSEKLKNTPYQTKIKTAFYQNHAGLYGAWIWWKKQESK